MNMLLITFTSMLCLIGFLFFIYFVTRKMRVSAISDDDQELIKDKIEWSQKPTVVKAPRKKKVVKKQVSKKKKVEEILLIEPKHGVLVEKIEEPKIVKPKKQRATRKVKVKEIEDIILDDIPTIVNSDNSTLQEIEKGREIDTSKSRPFWD